MDIYHYRASLEYIIKVHIEYIFFPIPMNATRGSTMLLILPLMKNNVFRVSCSYVFIVKNFAPYVDHLIHNETT